MKYKKRTPGHKELLNLFNNLSDIRKLKLKFK